MGQVLSPELPSSWKSQTGRPTQQAQQSVQRRQTAATAAMLQSSERCGRKFVGTAAKAVLHVPIPESRPNIYANVQTCRPARRQRQSAADVHERVPALAL